MANSNKQNKRKKRLNKSSVFSTINVQVSLV